jgi:hypothetical protein
VISVTKASDGIELAKVITPNRRAGQTLSKEVLSERKNTCKQRYF